MKIRHTGWAQSPWATKTEMKTIIQIFQISLLATMIFVMTNLLTSIQLNDLIKSIPLIKY